MNWKQIQKKYPKAINKYEKWAGAGRFSQYMTSKVFAGSDRILYDFFDELNISIGIVPVCTYKDDTVNKITDFDWHIIVVGKEYAIEDDPPICYKKRKEAESAAFTKAFEVLENSLKNDISQR